MKPGAWLRVPPYLEHLEDPPVHRLGPPLPVIQGVEGLQQDLSRGLLVEEQRPVLLTWGCKVGRAAVHGWLSLQETLFPPPPTSPPHHWEEGKAQGLARVQANPAQSLARWDLDGPISPPLHPSQAQGTGLTVVIAVGIRRHLILLGT